ncbi:membrane-associated phospholipid phosphatase [Pedobacter cryoconitis]|uniref:Membrane-associated phospholipid phosphatase n=1 Tax=Pedobacter cryoconitis TaxID=188932 RepID=A0A7W8ZPH8_9SPHI|nr:phosphatase PAP2 family protein [Pedobacter cryoconitis]MBB5637633.1 membrane-associated phospholipid phosphatase [Pedobacter cryoconitis]
MRFFSLIFMLCLPGMIFAQQTDTSKRDSSQSVLKVPVMKRRGLNPPQVKSFIVPAVLISYGLLSLGNNAVRRLDFSTKAELQEDHPAFAVHADNFLQFAPGVAFYALNLAGVKSKHGIVDGTALYVLSEAIMGVSTFSVKHIVGRERPNGSDNYSFPSGHTANAFAAAEFLNQEYRDVSPWIGYAGYTVATATGVLRMYNNKHWLSDVVAGAGFGIASTKLAYLIYPHLKKLVMGKQTMKYSLVPMYQQKAAGLAFSGTF